MEVRFESMVFLWDDKIPTMFLEFMNLLTLCQSEAAALGSEIKELMYLRSVSNNKIDLFLPESFEWLILRSAIFDRNDNVQEILADPAEHIDCENYFSWERFFTALLVAETNGRANLEYHENKSHIPSGYLSEQNIYSILNAMKK